jgi:hypothetical protein
MAYPRLKNYILACFLLLFAFPAIARQAGLARIYTYPLPSIYQQSTVFKLEAGGVSIPVVAYNPKYDYAEFSISAGQTLITISLPYGTPVNSYRISPQKLSINAIKKGNQLQFTLEKDEYLIVRINQLKELVIAADGEEKNKPEPAGKGIFNIEAAKYNADAFGKTLATKALQQAIDDAAAYPNGIVYVPSGVYAIGNIDLKSHTNLYLEGGAVLLFTGNPKDYTVHAYKTSQKRNITWWIRTDSGAHDIKIYGRGTIDGNGKYATDVGNIGNHILAIMCTDDFVFDGPIVRNSGAWGIIPARSKNVTFKNFKLFNRLDMGENDCMDVIESEHVLVKHGIGISLDDPFSTKTWEQSTDLCKNWPGTPQPQNDVVFEDLIAWTYCYAYKIGQGVFQPQSHISFKNCVVYDAAVGIGVHHKWGTAAVDHVLFDHIDIEKISHQNDDNSNWADFFIQHANKAAGSITDVTVSNINVYDAGTSRGKIKGVDVSNQVQNITFKNISMPGLAYPAKTLQELKMTDTAYAAT